MPESDGDEMLCHLKVRKAEPGRIMAKVSERILFFFCEKIHQSVSSSNNFSKRLHLGHGEWGFSQSTLQISQGESRLGGWTRLEMEL